MKDMRLENFETKVNKLRAVTLERYTDYQAEKRLKDMSVYCAYECWSRTGATKESIHGCLMREWGITNRKTLYNTIERGRKYCEEIMGKLLN